MNPLLNRLLLNNMLLNNGLYLVGGHLCIPNSVWPYNKNWSTTFYETTSCHVARIDDFTEAGEAIPGGVEFEQRILSLHVATWHIFERGRDRCETKWTEVRDAVAAFVD